MEQDERFSHPTKYKGIELRQGERLPGAKGNNRGVQAQLKLRRHLEAVQRTQHRDYVIARVQALIQAGERGGGWKTVDLTAFSTATLARAAGL